MKRSGPIRRKTPMESGSGQLARTPIKARSKTRSKLMRDVRAPAVAAAAESGRCEVGPILAAAGLWFGCTGRVEGLHERRKRSSAGSLVNPDNLVPSCVVCNGAIEDHPEVRDVTGTLLVVREGDPEWSALGARNDRFN